LAAANRHPIERSFQGVLTVAPEQQPCGVQVVERVGLVASSFQFFTRLAAVFVMPSIKRMPVAGMP